jgi:hypothetical protein
MRFYISLFAFFVVLGCTVCGFGCGDDAASVDGGPPSSRDGGSRDGGARDAGNADAALDAGRDAGESAIGQLCANDDNCTGAGQVCCLAERPSTCTLATECDGDPSGIPCDARDDCPTSRVCCRFPTETFCTPRRACDDLGGEEVP